jgi:hypothetical protein
MKRFDKKMLNVEEWIKPVASEVLIKYIMNP